MTTGRVLSHFSPEHFQDFNCAFSNNCAVDLNTRRFCQKCRLEKCFAVGMKKEWILSDNEKARKKSNKESKRYKNIFSPNIISPKLSVRNLTMEKSSAPIPGQVLGQGNKRKPSFGEWPEDWTSQELSFESEFSEDNTQQHLPQLETEQEQEKTEYFK